jgi:hypothetical protein
MSSEDACFFDRLPIAKSSEDACFFDRLPIAMRDSFLQQAFQLLHQRHRYGVVPLVCPLWRRLVTSTCSSLQVKVLDCVAIDSLTSRLERHHPPLEELKLYLSSGKYYKSGEARLLELACSKVSLQSLMIEYLPSAMYSTISLSSLTNLTSLELLSYCLSATTRDSLLSLTQLRSLKLVSKESRQDAIAPWLRNVSCSLLHLTALELSVGSLGVKPHYLLPLTTLRGLRHLVLTNMDVEAEGIAVLKQLPITDVMVSVEHGEVGELCSWLQEGGCRLITLHVGGNFFNPLSLPEVEMLLSHLCTFAPQLRILCARHMIQLGPSTGLAGLTQLTGLIMEDGCHDATLFQLSALTGLRELSMGYNEVTGGPFECLASSLQ